MIVCGAIIYVVLAVDLVCLSSLSIHVYTQYIKKVKTITTFVRHYVGHLLTETLQACHELKLL